MPLESEGALCSELSVAMPLGTPLPVGGGGTVAAEVVWPEQKRSQFEVVVMGGKIAPEFCVCMRSEMRPPQPVEAMPLGMAVCHWLL